MKLPTTSSTSSGRDRGSRRADAAKAYGEAPPRRDALAREIAALRTMAQPCLPALEEPFQDGGRLTVKMELGL